MMPLTLKLNTQCGQDTEEGIDYRLPTQVVEYGPHDLE